MIRLFIAFFFLLTSFIASSQKDSSSFRKLVNQFAATYSLNEKESGNHSSLSALEFSVHNILIPENPHFRDTWNSFKTAFPLLGIDKLSDKITDSVLEDFFTTNAWKGDTALAFRFSSVLNTYTQKICDCITGKIKNGNENRVIEYQTECEKKISADQQFITSFREQVAKIAVADRLKILPLMQKDMYEHCPVFTQYVNTYQSRKVKQAYYQYLDNLVSGVYIDIIQLYKNQQADSLLKIFPDYKKYGKDIELSAPMNAVKNYTVIEGPAYMQEVDVPSIRSMVFYTAKEKTKLEGQVILNYIISDFKIKITGYKYVPAGKIQNKESIIRDLEFVPAPPPPPFKKETGQ